MSLPAGAWAAISSECPESSKVIMARHGHGPVRRVTIWFAADAPLTCVIVTYAV